MDSSSTGFVLFGTLIMSLVFTTYVELYCFLLYLGYLVASLLVMIEKFAMIWLSLVGNYVYVVDNQEFVQTVICQAHSACGLIAQHALRVVEPWQLNVVVAWEVPGRQGYHYYSLWL